MSSSHNTIQKNSLGLSLASACQFRRPGVQSAVKKSALAAWKAKSQSLGKLVMKMEDQIYSAQEVGYGKFLDDVVKFVANGTKDSCGFVATALVKLGTNLSDNEVVFGLVENRLHTDIADAEVIQLSSTDISSMSNILAKLSSHILDKGILRRLFGEHKPKKSWLQSLTYSTMIEIRKQLGEPLTKLVLLIPELDSVDSNTGLKQLFPVLKRHLEHLPCVLVCGTYTNAITLQHLLPARVTDCLFVETFVIREPRAMFEEIVEKTVISTEMSSFKLGPQLIDLVVENFIFRDYSLQTLASLIKVGIFKHFFSSHLAAKFTAKNEHRISSEFNKLPAREMQTLINDVKKLPSMADCKVPRDASAFKQFVKHCVIDIKSAFNAFATTLTYLFVLTRDLPEKPFGNSFSELFTLAAKQKLVATPECENALRAFKFLSLDELKEAIEQCLKHVGQGECEGEPFATLLRKHLKAIADLERQGDERDAKAQPVATVNLSQCKSRAEWKEKLKNSIAPRPLSAFESWRLNFVNDVKELLSELKSPYSMPLHEVLFFDDVGHVDERCFPSPRTEIVATFKQPLSELQLSGTKGDNLPAELDITMIYNHLLHSNHSVNLHDMLEAFKCARGVRKTSPVKKSKSKGKLADTTDRRHLLRFFNAIEDFEYIGLVAKNKRKCDHVTKLAWE